MSEPIPLTIRCFEADNWRDDLCPFKGGLFCTDPYCAVESAEVTLPCSVSDHEKRLRRLACCVSGKTPVTLHHLRGGTVATSLFGSPGAGQKQNDALQIPLHVEYHVGVNGIDSRISGGVLTWETRWGGQIQHLSSISRRLRYSPWTLAFLWASPLVQGRVARFLGVSRSRFHQQ